MIRPLLHNARWKQTKKKTPPPCFVNATSKLAYASHTPNTQTRYNNGNSCFLKLKWWKQVQLAAMSDAAVAVHRSLCPQSITTGKEKKTAPLSSPELHHCVAEVSSDRRRVHNTQTHWSLELLIGSQPGAQWVSTPRKTTHHKESYCKEGTREEGEGQFMAHSHRKPTSATNERKSRADGIQQALSQGFLALDFVNDVADL